MSLQCPCKVASHDVPRKLLFGCFRIGPLIGLFLMAIACGNIKPCLAAFGGDQFRSDQVTITGFPVYLQPNQRFFFVFLFFFHV